MKPETDPATTEVPNTGASSTSAMLRIENLDLIYESSRGPVGALKGLSLKVGKGEFISVLGPSGCGKSTLLRILSGLLTPTAGEAIISGRPVVGPRQDVGVVFQQPTLLPWKNVLENVLVPIRAMKRPVDQYREQAHTLLKLVGLAEFASHYPHELSGGMQQRVGIARGLIHDPDILLMDEPFAALDAMSRDFMMEELQRIWMGTGKSVLFITHSIPEAIFLSDRVVTLSHRPGRVIDDLPIDLPRPRTVTTIADSHFGQLTAQLRRHFEPGSTTGGDIRA